MPRSGGGAGIQPRTLPCFGPSPPSHPGGWSAGIGFASSRGWGNSVLTGPLMLGVSGCLGSVHTIGSGHMPHSSLPSGSSPSPPLVWGLKSALLMRDEAGTWLRSCQTAEGGSVLPLLVISFPPANHGVRIVKGTGGPQPRGELYCHLGLTCVAPGKVPGCPVCPLRSPGTSGRKGTCPSPGSGH